MVTWRQYETDLAKDLEVLHEKLGQSSMQRPALVFDYDCAPIGQSWILHADCLEWLSRIPENCVHAVVTDPPYGVKEYDPDQLEK